jgi:site-specific recombinase XerD
LQARDNNTLPALRRGQDLQFGEWADFYLENFSKPPFRAQKTHEVNQRALKHLRKMFENTKLANVTADDIEMYLRRRLKQRVLVKSEEWILGEGQVLKATTVHQELRVLRRMLNVAVRKKFLFANPCAGVEFPARVDGLFRPHYVSLVRAAEDRVQRAGVPAQRHPDRHRNRTSDLQRADSDEEGSA